MATTTSAGNGKEIRVEAFVFILNEELLSEAGSRRVSSERSVTLSELLGSFGSAIVSAVWRA